MAQSGGNSHSLAADKVGASLSGGVAMMMRTIDLMTVRMQLGERFPAISERLHAQLQKDLKQALTGFGWFWPMGGLFYLIVLWGITESEADALVQRLLKQLHSNLRSLKFDTTGLFIPVNAAHFSAVAGPASPPSTHGWRGAACETAHPHSNKLEMYLPSLQMCMRCRDVL